MTASSRPRSPSLPPVPTPAPRQSPAPAPGPVHERVRELLADVGAALLREEPALGGFEEARPGRDRPSGDTWGGAPTAVHVSALLAALRTPALSRTEADALVGAARTAAGCHGAGASSQTDRHGIRQVVWMLPTGDRLELVLGVRLALRVLRAPVLPDGAVDAAPADSSPAALLSASGSRR